MTSRYSKKRRRCARILFTVSVFLIIAQVVFSLISFGVTAQDNSRKIVSDDFTKNRKKAAGDIPAKPSAAEPANSPTTKSRVGRTYKPALSSSKSTRQKSPAPAVVQLGITIWKLRPVQQNEPGARLLVREKGGPTGWVAERVEADATFREGDHVRLSIESARAGYLYVVDRDLLKDGNTGDAMLIYPWTNMADSDNRVWPGKLIDIPAQEDDPNLFTARLTSPNQIGELLTIIISTTPLQLPLSDKPIQISSRDLAMWEKQWGAPIERFELEGGAGQAWTKEEQQAAASKGVRQLTREDPPPQTLYRIPVTNNKAILVNVTLHYAK